MKGMILSKKLILAIKEWRMQWVIPSDARQRTGREPPMETARCSCESKVQSCRRSVQTWRDLSEILGKRLRWIGFCHFGNVAVICLSDVKPSISAWLFMTNSNKMKYCLDWRWLKSSMTRQPCHWPLDVAWCVCKNPKRFVSEDLRLKQDSWLKEAGMKLYLGPSER